MPLINRFASTMQGALVLTGNTLQIKGNTTYPAAGQAYINGSYISTNTALVATTGFPPGTTFSGSQCSSTAILNIPNGSTVMYAQLFWIAVSPGNVNAPITFNTPIGSNTITPNSSLTQFLNPSFWIAQDVTSIVNAAGSGIYTVLTNPGATIVNGSSLNGASWCLLVAYKNTSLPYRYININTGFASVSSGAPSDFTFTNILTPSSGTVNGYLLVSESYGDLQDGAQIFVGATQGTSSTVGNASTGTWNGVAPYAQVNNMLPSNILIADCNDPNIGLLDTRGTFGANNNNPFATTSPAFARNVTDILGVNISNKLTNNQTSLFTRVFYGGSGAGNISSQSIQIDINSPTLSPLTKYVDKTNANIGDTLTYTITFTNTGSLAASNVVFLDTIPNYSSFIVGSALLNGVTVPSNPQSGISIGTVAIGQRQTVTFKVLVNTTLANGIFPVTNVGNISYNFVPGGALPAISDYLSSNTVTTTIANNTSLTGITKAVDKTISAVGDILNYTITIPNTGAITAANVLFSDTVPNGTTFILNSFLVNGVVTTVTNPGSPYNIGNISPNGITTITFSVKVGTTIPTPNPIPNSAQARYLHSSGTTFSNNSNIVNTQINSAVVSSSKIVNKAYANIGDILTYTIPITNSGNVTAINLFITDTIPNGTSYITGSLNQDGTTVVGVSSLISASLPINIPSNRTTTISFKVQITTLPNPNPIANIANIGISYIIDSSTTPTRFGAAATNTNIANTQVNNASLGNITKSVDKTFANCGDTITYTIVIPNSGNVTAQNVIFKDTIPNGTVLVPTSVIVNNVSTPGPNPNTGVTIPNIAPGSTATLSFSVVVTCI